MYQITGKAQSKATTLILLAVLVVAALYAAMQVVVRPIPDVQVNVAVPRADRAPVQDVAINEYLIEYHMNPFRDRSFDPELAANYRAERTLRADLIEYHMNPLRDRSFNPELAADYRIASAMQEYMIAQHMNPAFGQ